MVEEMIALEAEGLVTVIRPGEDVPHGKVRATLNTARDPIFECPAR